MNTYYEKALETLKNWISVRSVKGEATQNKPFGEEIDKMLTLALNDAKSLGFETYNYDGFCGEVVFGSGKDEDGLAILCHLDIVPEGDKNAWQTNPFTLTENGGELVGRGVVDDKGPACLCLYALKELKDEGFIPNRKIKLIFGLDEECDWGCMEHYAKVATMSNEGFSPDGDFPVIYAEKGLYPVEFKFKKSNKIKSIFGGDRINMVCDKVKVAIENETLVFNGITAHGSTPEQGDNAMDKALKYLRGAGLFDDKDYENLFLNGKGLLNYKDETGALTFSPNVITSDENYIYIKVDVRYPISVNKEELHQKLEEIGDLKVLNDKAPLYVPKDSLIIKTLVSLYNTHFNKNESPVAIGGGTYAKILKKGVAFGPSQINDSCCHVPNEHVNVEYFEKCYKVYKEAIKKLSSY